MCGRIVQKSPTGFVLQLLGIEDDEVGEIRPRFNVPPGAQIVAVRMQGDRPELTLLRWGLIPSWAKDEKIAFKMINARAETILEKPSFRAAFKARRCLIPVDGFYEWKADGKEKIPHLIRIGTNELCLLAGLWESWRSPEGKVIESCTIITTEAPEELTYLHHRMPVVIPLERREIWLRSDSDVETLTPLLNANALKSALVTRVSQLVNSPKNDDPKCLEAVAS